jgi:hypothetical protein
LTHRGAAKRTACLTIAIRFLQRIQRNFFALLQPWALATPDRDFGDTRLSSLSHPSEKLGVSMPKKVATATFAQDREKYSRFGKDAETIQRLERVPNARDTYRLQ